MSLLTFVENMIHPIPLPEDEADPKEMRAIDQLREGLRKNVPLFLIEELLGQPDDNE
jgi:hypothetical protein